MKPLNPSDLFPFPLDRFQQDAIAALDVGKSVVVCAPTGSGKTLIGEYAIHSALADRQRVFYTTPLKALSNQKFRDFGHRYGSDRVGLLTGDLSVNRDAPVLVMTTEIFRNMLYGTPIGEVGTSLVDVQAVVLDECHYMNDAQRGTVWEESIIYCPPDIQLVALSATVANSDQLTDWIAQVHGPTELIYSDFRPVPLQFSFCNPKGLFPLLDDDNKKINPRLKPSHKPRNRPDGNAERAETPSLAVVVSRLAERDMLPAIYFIFSRKGCDRAVKELNSLFLVNDREAAFLRQRLDEFLLANPDLGRSPQVEALYRGIAVHHAGILPAWKGLVEELFQQGVIKVVFATETLAAGINMPARTTVISSLSKRTDRGHRLLTASEFLQMAGRAGRRGMDELGYVVTIQTAFEGAREAAHLATSNPDPLASQFTPSYGMVLNLLQTHSLEEAKELVERSFGQYLSDLALMPQVRDLEAIQLEVARLEKDLASLDLKLMDRYEKLRDRLREERRLLKILMQQAEEQRLDRLAAGIPSILSGTSLLLRSPKGFALPCVLAAKVPGSGRFPWFVCLGKDNVWYVITYKDVLALGDLWHQAELPFPAALVLKPGNMLSGDAATQAIAAAIPLVSLPDPPPEVQHQEELVLATEAKIADHPVEQWPDKGNTIKRARKLEQLQRELEFKRNVLERRRQHYWDEFLSLVEILRSYGCLSGVHPTTTGQVAAALRGDNELWLALTMLSTEFDDLEPQHLAAACAALVTENSRPDTWTHFQPSEAVENALGGLRGMRRQLFQIQRRYNVTLPVSLEYEFVGAIEQWALGAEWSELCLHTSLDEGDIVRAVRRTLDLLSQIPHVPGLPEKLCRTAKQAAGLIDRFPVNEIV